jgi:hypothetical protein
VLLRHLNDGELKDIGLYRSQIEFGMRNGGSTAIAKAGRRERQMRKPRATLRREALRLALGRRDFFKLVHRNMLLIGRDFWRAVCCLGSRPSAEGNQIK